MAGRAGRLGQNADHPLDGGAALASSSQPQEASLEQQLAHETDRAVRLQQRLDAGEAELRRFGNAIVAGAAQIEKERARSEFLSRRAAELEAALAEHEGAAAAGDDVVTESETQLRHEIAALRDQVAAMSESLLRATADSAALREVLSSKSWKMTSPLRRAARFARRGFWRTAD